MKPFRCLNDACMVAAQRFDFDATDPICPKCGLDGRTDGRDIVTALAVIHFIPLKRKVNGRGVGFGDGAGQGIGYVACDPTRKLRGLVASDQPVAVTCWDCRQTGVFKEAKRLAETPDEAAALKAAGGVVVEEPAGCCG